MTVNRILFGVMLISCFGIRTYGQTIISNSYLGARNAALGNANISEPHDISSIYENPSAIAFLENQSVVINDVQGSYGEMQQNVAFPVEFDENQELAVGAEVYSLGELNHTQYAKRYAIGYDIAFANKINPTMSVGGSVSLRRGVVVQTGSAIAASYMLGLDYVPDPDMSYGVTFGGLGTGVDFVTSNSVVSAIQTNSPRYLEIGAVMHFPGEGSLQRSYLSVALASEKILGTSGVEYRGGVEFYPFHFVALRFGYVAGPSIHEQRYGIGVREGVLHLDFVVYPVNQNESKFVFEQMSASVEF